jgi:hypothetical protein
VEPAVDDRGLGGVGPLPVAFHHVVPADDDFAGLAGRGFGAVWVDQFHFDTVDGQSDRTGFGSPGTVVRGGRRRLGQSVAFEDRCAEGFLEAVEHFDR